MVQHLLIENNGLDPIEETVLRTAYELILSKEDHIASAALLPVSQVTNAVLSLKNRGLVACGFRDRTLDFSPEHLFVTDRALDYLGVRGPSGHDEANRSQLIPRIPLLNPVYHAVGMLVPELGTLRRFQWFTDAGLDAASFHERGWASFMGSGALESDLHFQRRLEDLPRRMHELAVTPETPRPAVILVIPMDSWQKELVRQAVRRAFFPPQLLQIWSLDDGHWPGPDGLMPSQGEIRQPVPRRDLGGWSWEARLEQAIYAKTGSEVEVLRLLAEWGELSTNWIKEARGERPDGRTTQRALTKLLGAGLIQRRGARRSYTYFPSNRALEQLRLRDGIGAGQGGQTSEQIRNRLLRHETGMKGAMLPFIAARYAVACGTRSWEDMGQEGGGISPDAMVRLNDTPFGPGWFYYEHELWSQDLEQVTNKLGGYPSPLRRDDFPLLLACANDVAEQVFHMVGRQMGISMLTTTIPRLRQHGPLGNMECWSLYGEMVQIG